MLYLTLKALISGILIAAASEIAKRYPGVGALVASLPLVSVLGMIWLWHDKPDPRTMAAHAGATFWYVPFWLSLLAGCMLTIGLYAAMTWAAPRLGIQL
jgi:hypothetical protein